MIFEKLFEAVAKAKGWDAAWWEREKVRFAEEKRTNPYGVTPLPEPREPNAHETFAWPRLGDGRCLLKRPSNVDGWMWIFFEICDEEGEVFDDVDWYLVANSYSDAVREMSPHFSFIASVDTGNGPQLVAMDGKWLSDVITPEMRAQLIDSGFNPDEPHVTEWAKDMAAWDAELKAKGR